jgi:HlyD family secretion protein
MLLRSCLILFILLLNSCSHPHQSTLSGYVEGDYLYISSNVPGTLFSLDVTEGQFVSKGRLLFKLDPQPEADLLQSAKATIAQLQAEVNLAEIQLNRQKKLYLKNATDKSTLDIAQTTYISQWQKLQAGYAQFKQSQWALNQKMVYAPDSGQVFDTFFRVGEKVSANSPVLALLPPANIRLTFFIPETELATVHTGQTVYFSCDHCRGKTPASIYYISPEAEYTPPIIYSKNTRNKLVYQIRASIQEKVAPQFHPGQPVDIYIETNTSS